MTWSESYTKRHRALAPTTPIRRAACAFDGCQMPPTFTIGGNGYRYCHAHKKQRDRGQTLRPYTPRSDVEAQWETWARNRAGRNRTRSLGLKHRGPCGGLMRVLVTHTNGHRGHRTCWCSKCGRNVNVRPDGTQRLTRSRTCP